MANNHPHSTETRAKISASLSGRTISAEVLAKRIGRKASEETKAKMRIAQSNPSPEIRAKLRAARSNRDPDSAETRARKSAASRGRPKSMEHRVNMSKSRLGKYVGENNPNWKGGQIDDGYGYECIRIHPGFYLKVHRLTMTQILGRKLKNGEIVHHINKNKMDNRPDNLALCSDPVAHGWCRSEDAKIFLGNAGAS